MKWGGGLGGILKNIFFEPWDQGLFKNISLMDGEFFLFHHLLQQAVDTISCLQQLKYHFSTLLLLSITVLY